MDLGGIEPPFAACKAAVLPLNERPRFGDVTAGRATHPTGPAYFASPWYWMTNRRWIGRVPELLGWVTLPQPPAFQAGALLLSYPAILSGPFDAQWAPTLLRRLSFQRHFPEGAVGQL